MNHHTSRHGIAYLHINSASYFWMGGRGLNQGYPEELRRARPLLENIAPYRKPLFTLLEWNPVEQCLRLRPATSDWMFEPPQACGYEAPRLYKPSWISPRISGWSRRLGGETVERKADPVPEGESRLPGVA
jgi:hypothetical protein